MEDISSLNADYAALFQIWQLTCKWPGCAAGAGACTARWSPQLVHVIVRAMAVSRSSSTGTVASCGVRFGVVGGLMIPHLSRVNSQREVEE